VTDLKCDLFRTYFDIDYPPDCARANLHAVFLVVLNGID
jgi:hypothetical protein